MREAALPLAAVVCVAASLTPVAWATPGLSRLTAAAAEIDLRPPPGMRSRSVGFPWNGHLMRGLRLRQSDYVRYLEEAAPKSRFYATWELVQLLERAARRVAFRLPGAKLSVGELSGANGGRIDGHRSHQSGRDVDVGFYATLPDGKPQYTYAFAAFDANGHGHGANDYLRFDDARNWELVAKLLSDGEARVQYVFLANPLRQRLLAYAVKTGASRALIDRARAAVVQPARGNPHKTHFHVRIYCAPADRGACRDQGPIWPWYPGSPPATGYSPLSSPLPGAGAL